MFQESLKALGIRLSEEIPVSVLLDEKFSGKLAGLSDVQTRKIKALRDIITEYNKSVPDIDTMIIDNPVKASSVMRFQLKGLDHEECWAVYLNRSNIVIKKAMISIGSISATMIDIRRLIRDALLLSASGIILYHNHPSNNPHPGKNDIEVTESLKKASQVFDLSLVDHIIICDGSYFSFAQDRVEEFTEETI